MYTNIQKWWCQGCSLPLASDSFLCCLIFSSFLWISKIFDRNIFERNIKLVSGRLLTSAMEYSRISLDNDQVSSIWASVCTFEHHRPVWQPMLTLPAWQSAVRHCARFWQSAVRHCARSLVRLLGRAQGGCCCYLSYIVRRGGQCYGEANRRSTATCGGHL